MFWVILTRPLSQQLITMVAMHPGERKFIVRSFSPAYEKLTRTGEIARRVEQALKMLRRCSVCPRACQVDRMSSETKFCQTGRHAQISSACAHFGEERCLVGHGGSGTIFFAQCNLRCVFCQNADISQQGQGMERTPRQIADPACGRPA